MMAAAEDNPSSFSALSTLPNAVSEFLNSELRPDCDFTEASNLLGRLDVEGSEALKEKTAIEDAIQKHALEAARNAKKTIKALASLASRIQGTMSTTSYASANMQPLVAELAQLAVEVSRVERIRVYVERVLELERLVGDVEDAVADAVQITTTPMSRGDDDLAMELKENKIIKLQMEAISAAVEAIQRAAKAVAEVGEVWPQWKQLLMACDVRLDHAAAILHPPALSAYRACLLSAGWPPPLSSQGVQNRKALGSSAMAPTESQGRGGRKGHFVENLKGELREHFEGAFVALSVLQAIQRQQALRREHRLSGGAAGEEPLWSVQELANPLAAQMDIHFAKWPEQPEYVFSLTLRTLQGQMEFIDTLLQPLLDGAGFAGISLREEWCRAMAAPPVEHLRRRTIPHLVSLLKEEKGQRKSSKGDAQQADRPRPALSLWRHTVDLALQFDARLKTLAADATAPPSSRDVSDSMAAAVTAVPSCVNVFSERHEWLDLWIEVELNHAQTRVRQILAAGGAWNSATNIHALQALAEGVASEGNLHVAQADEFRPPGGAEAVLGVLRATLQRCWGLAGAAQRLAFVHQVSSGVLRQYIEAGRACVREAEALTALAAAPDMARVGRCVSGMYFFQHMLEEWGEEASYLALYRISSKEAPPPVPGSSKGASSNSDDEEGTVFDEFVHEFGDVCQQWLSKIAAAMLRGFEARSAEYIRSRSSWKDSERPASGQLSPQLVDAISSLQAQLDALQSTLPAQLFLSLWRQVASTLDQFLLESAVTAGARFTPALVQQLTLDVEVLYSVFGTFTARPAGFFKGLRNATVLLRLPRPEASALLQLLSNLSSQDADEEGEEMKAHLASVMKRHGVTHMKVTVVRKVLEARADIMSQ